MLEELAADGPDPVFREGVDHRCPDGRPKDLESFGPEDLVEGVDELAAPVTNQSPSGAQSIAVVEEQVAGGLGVEELRPSRVGALAGEASVAKVDRSQRPTMTTSLRWPVRTRLTSWSPAARISSNRKIRCRRPAPTDATLPGMPLIAGWRDLLVAVVCLLLRWNLKRRLYECFESSIVRLLRLIETAQVVLER